MSRRQVIRVIDRVWKLVNENIALRGVVQLMLRDRLARHRFCVNSVRPYTLKQGSVKNFSLLFVSHRETR